MNLPVGAATVIITLTRVAESRMHNAKRPGWPGFVVFTAALASLVYRLIESGQRTFSSSLVLGLPSTGLRVLVMSAGIVVTSVVAGRLSSRVPVRWLISPGLVTVGAGLLLMRGVHAQSSWTHLVPGLLVAGLSRGMVSPPLASAAVGNVGPARAGMASGISTTFRQVGIATGVALLGTLFSSQVRNQAIAGVSQMRTLTPKGGQIAAAVQSGTIGKLIAHLPPPVRPAAGVVALATIRGKDFAAQQDPPVRQVHGVSESRQPATAALPRTGK